MKERPILFSGPMVRAILEGRKTQTRRVVKWSEVEPGLNLGFSGLLAVAQDSRGWVLTSMSGGCWQERCAPTLCTYGVPGDRMWVRETWSGQRNRPIAECELFYRADGEHQHGRQLGLSYAERESKWRPSIFMPRWASRLTLEVKAVRVERLQKISEADAIAEGIRLVTKDGTVNKFCVYDLGDYSSTPWSEMSRDAVSAYRSLWDSINAKRGHGWETNPWVWVVEFKAVTR